MTRDRIATSAVMAMSLVATVFPIYIGPLIVNSDMKTKAIYAVVVAFAFSAIFFIITHVLSRFRYRKLTGTWYYRTKPHNSSSHQDGSYAIMKFHVNRDYDIEYHVDVFATLVDVSKPKTATLKGTAHSVAVRYDLDKGCVDLIFHVKILESEVKNQSRYGRLSLNFTSNSRLDGNWTSEVKSLSPDGNITRIVSSGKMSAFRSIESLREFDKNE